MVDAVLPPRCLSCGVVVTTGGAICPNFWTGIDFISDPFCSCCGIPLAYDPGSGGLCGACAREAPAFGGARSLIIYNDVSRKLILSFKHADRTDAAPVWGGVAGPCGRGTFGGGRRTGAGAVVSPPADIPAIQPGGADRDRTRPGNRRAGLGERDGAGPADAEPGLHEPPVAGRQCPRRVCRTQPFLRAHRGARIVLVDDVFTAGATLTACTRALQKAGAESVDAITLARVTRTG